MLEWLNSIGDSLSKISDEDLDKIFDRFAELVKSYKMGKYNLVYGQDRAEMERICTELEELGTIISFYRDPVIAKKLDDYIKVNLIVIPTIKQKGVESLPAPEFF